MEFSLLGPLEVADRGALLAVGGGRQRLLLALLLCHANRVVAVEHLVDVLWGSAPPPTSGKAVHVLIHQLRRALGDQGRIVHRPGGYTIVTRPDEIDAVRFERLAEQGGQALEDGDHRKAQELLNKALSLWRGPALADVRQAAALGAEALRLEELHLTALERRIAADLALGREAELVGELRALVAKEPLREKVRAQYMLALYRTARQAEALEVYRQGRARMVRELGLEPGPELRRLERAILREDPSLRRASALPVPRQLPPAVADFTGRDEQCARLHDLMAMPGAEHVVIAGIDGPGGVGKSTLAIRVAHGLAELFPDGRLYANLHGSTPGLTPLSPGEVLARFLRSLGVDAAGIPGETEEAAAQFRSLLAGRRMLVVLDNALGPEQVRPLLPGTPGTAVLITSRQALTTLEGAAHVHLDVLSEPEALELLARICGVDRGPAAELVRLCGLLPLAVRIAGAWLAARPGIPAEALVERLSNSHRRLEELQYGDLSVGASIAVSHDDLDSAAARVFRLLGTLDAAEIALPVTSAAAGLDARRTAQALDRLTEARLIEQMDGDRYQFHDLVRMFARQKAMEIESEDEHKVVLGRVMSCLLAQAEEAFRRTFGSDRQLLRNGAPVHSELPKDPFAWFDAERLVIMTTVRQGAREGLDDLSWRLGYTAFHLVEIRSHTEAWKQTLDAVYTAARRSENDRGQAATLLCFGRLKADQEDYVPAMTCLRQAETLFEYAGDRHGQALALAYAADVHRLAGRTEQATQGYEKAAKGLQDADDEGGEAFVLCGIGLIHLERGERDIAESRFEQALSRYRRVGSRWGVARTLYWLGSEPALREMLEITRELGSRPGQALALLGLSAAQIRREERDESQALLAEALAIAQEVLAPYARAKPGGLRHARRPHNMILFCLREGINLADQLGAAEIKAHASRLLDLLDSRE